MEIKEFFTKFFTNLGATVKDNTDSIEITGIPERFEKFAGKKGPYLLSFQQKEGFELVTPTHYLLKIMKEFLEGRGETTLIKIQHDFELKEKIPEVIPFRNAKITNFSAKAKYDFIFRFTFATNFQYLNEKEQTINNIYVKDNQLLDFDLNNYLHGEGSKRDLKEIEIDQDYEVAKTKLKELIQPKVEEISKKLNNALDTEIERVKAHYKSQMGEVAREEAKLLSQIQELEESQEDQDKLERFEKQLDKIKENDEFKKAKEEEKFFLDHEEKKHGLSIKNKLMNTSIIYFPSYDISFLASAKGRRMINMEYDPMTNKRSDLHCDSCDEKIDEIIICATGHLTCRTCGERCQICEGVYCKACSTKKCHTCSREMCSSCNTACSSCRKTFCKIHSKSVDGRHLCNNCMQVCSTCGKIADSSVIKDNTCVNCKSKEKSSQVLDSIFKG